MRSSPGETVKIGGAGGAIEALPFRQIHGSGETLGFRFGGLAYSPDVSDLPEESLKHLHDLDVWIIDALRLHAASEPFLRGAGACLDRAGQAEARGADPYACRSRLRDACAASCRKASSPPMTAWC